MNLITLLSQRSCTVKRYPVMEDRLLFFPLLCPKGTEWCEFILTILKQLYLKWLHASLALGMVESYVELWLCVYFPFFLPLIIVFFLHLPNYVLALGDWRSGLSPTNYICCDSKAELCQGGTYKNHLMEMFWI